MKTIKYIIIIFIISAIAGGAVLYIKQRYAVTPINVSTTAKPNSKIDEDSASNKPDVINLPTSLLLPVPFTPQAPTANWDELHNEACEEAVAIMAHEYFIGNAQLTLKPEFVETEITTITKWFTKQYSYYLDTTSTETASMIEELYNLNTTLVENFTENDIKQALTQNKLVLISFNGRLLGNPNYKRPGPIHHMLLIKGYSSEGLITNDPGTKKGLNYSYDFETLFNAAGDWDHLAKTVDLNKKIAIIVSAK